MPSDYSPPWASVDEVAADVITCPKCRLSETRTHAVPGDGSSSAAVMFIGEGPGQNEDEQGLPFVGRAGKLLDSLLAEVPLKRGDVFITNVVKCRPPGNRDPEPDEVAACYPYLLAQIALIRPRVIVTLGRHSMARFYPEGKISRDHGRIINIGERVLLPLYHPAAALRNPALEQTLREDIRRIPEAIRESLRIGRAAAQRPMAGSNPSTQPEKTAQSSIFRPEQPPQPGAKTAGEHDDKGQMSLF
jgi:DNA polymerase